MNIAAYCRVSTDSADQLNSLEAQKRFFDEYTEKNGHELVRLYADEGISGTKIKNRKEFLRLMRDARQGLFEMVVVKDISRFARNTVDLLNSTRQLKGMNIETLFLTANMTVLGNSEFILTIFGALAQEESANTSKRVKFGKKLNAQRGRVPNIVYGYDKIPGDYFNMEINQPEAEIIRRIYDLYINYGYGAAKIAQLLNADGIKTKRNCNWSQNAVSRILANELYTGKVINGKQEIEDFLTGVRREKNEADWMITERADLRIIEPDLFERAKRVLSERHKSFKITGERQSNKYLFSTLIKCSECGYSFRRVERTYKNTYVRWVCSGRNLNGADSCGNKTIIDEESLVESLGEYFTGIIAQKSDIFKRIAKEFVRVYRTKDDNEDYQKDLLNKLTKLQKTRQKYLDMYADGLISREELRERVGRLNSEMGRLEDRIKLTADNLSKGSRLEDILNDTFKTVQDVVSMETVTNAQLKKIFRRMVVDKNGNIDIYLRLFSDIGLSETFLDMDDRT